MDHLQECLLQGWSYRVVDESIRFCHRLCGDCRNRMRLPLRPGKLWHPEREAGQCRSRAGQANDAPMTRGAFPGWLPSIYTDKPSKTTLFVSSYCGLPAGITRVV